MASLNYSIRLFLSRRSILLHSSIIVRLSLYSSSHLQSVNSSLPAVFACAQCQKNPAELYCHECFLTKEALYGEVSRRNTSVNNERGKEMWNGGKWIIPLRWRSVLNVSDQFILVRDWLIMQIDQFHHQVDHPRKWLVWWYRRYIDGERRRDTVMHIDWVVFSDSIHIHSLWSIGHWDISLCILRKEFTG